MRTALVVAAVTLMTAAAGASAQGLATADLPGMEGGTGISRHGTGFSGTMGDPAYYSGSSEAPESEGRYSPFGTMGLPRPGARTIPGGIPYEVAPPPMQYRFNPYSGR